MPRAPTARLRGLLPLCLLLVAPAAAAQSAPPPADSAAPAAPRTLLARPGGDTLGALAPGAPVELIGREGEWARVRVEGWVRVPPGAALAPPRPGQVSLAALRGDPERYRGRTIRWEVRYVGLQRADTLRTDLAPGEPYMLARDPGGEPGFVYVVVPARLLPEVRRLTPMQRVTVVARVRTGRSALMGHPVLELTELIAPRPSAR